MSTSDLLADLQVDRHRPTGPAEPARLPALEVRITPLHWVLPRLARTGSRWSAAVGPVHAALLLG